MRIRPRRLAAVAGLVVAALLVASCSFGETRPADDVTDVGVTFHGLARNTVAEATTYWFEYGPTTSYGTSTPQQSVNAANVGQGYPVEATVGGLAEGRTYHYRLCTRGADGAGTCGRDLSATTTSGRDSVSGTGIVLDLGFGYVIGAQVFATSGPGGSGPVRGDAVASPGSVYFKIPDEGAVTCLRVEGNRAAIGLMVTPPDLGQPDLTPFPRLIFVEDNGSVGDRLGFGSIAAPATTCPVPTDADFPGFDVGEVHLPPFIGTGGDFVVHDHCPAP